jgi:hypothetical protein
MCCTFPDTRWVLGRKELKNLKLTSLATFFKIAKHHGLKKDIHYTYNQQDSIITWWTDSQMLLYDLKYNPSDPLYLELGGLEITCGLIEESNKIPGAARKILKTRCGNWNNSKYGIKPLLIETFNPSKGHIYQYFWKSFKSGVMPDYRKFIRALPADNTKDPNIATYIQELERNPDRIIRERLLYGNFDYDDDPQKIFIYDKLNDLFHNTHAKEGEKYMSIDPSGKGRDRTVITMWNGMRVFHIFQEQISDQKDLHAKARDYQQKFSIPNSNTIVDHGGLGVGLRDFLECIGFQGGAQAFTTQMQKQEELRSDYRNLRAQCYFKLAELANKNEVHIESDEVEVQDKIVEELDVITEINDGRDQKKQIIPKGSIKDEPGLETIRSQLGRSPDFANSLIMRMYFEVAKRPEPGIRLL